MAEEAQGARPAVLTRFEEELESCDCDSGLVAGLEHCPGVGYAIEYGSDGSDRRLGLSVARQIKTRIEKTMSRGVVRPKARLGLMEHGSGV